MRGRASAIPAAALAAALLWTAAPAAAQIPPDLAWSTLETERFRVTFAPGLEAQARFVASRAEAAYQTLAAELTRPPSGPIDILVTDNTDFANGFATPFPSNRIVLYTTPAVDALGLSFHDNWLDLLITHELTHIFHLDRAGPVGRALRSVLGRAPLIWPLFPGALTPGWNVEGLATHVESRFTGFGRAHGTYHEMVLRTAVLEGAFFDIDQATGSSPVWPAGQVPYIYGSLFYEHLQERYGPEAMREITERTARTLVPPFLGFDRIGEKALGRSFTEEWRAWATELEARYAALADSLRARGLTRGERVTDGGGHMIRARVSPDGALLAYVHDDRRDEPGIRVLDARTGETRAFHRINVGGGRGTVSWTRAGALLTAEPDFTDSYHIFHDLYRLAPGERTRLSHGARLSQPEPHPDGRRILAVQNAGASNRLVLFDPATGALEPLTDFLVGEYWAYPRWSPDGTRIAAARWREGGLYDVVVLDDAGRDPAPLMRDLAIDAQPAWSPDGRYLIFSSDRTGITNLFAVELETGRILQVTNVLGGAYYPEVSPDGEWIYFSAYHAHGFDIERIPYAPGSWRDAPEPEPRLRAEADGAGADPGAYPGVSAAAAAAEVRPYRPWRTLRPFYWLPIALDEGVAGTFYGALTTGVDLVGRHSYGVSLMVDPSTSRAIGGFAYRWAGLGEPAVELAGSRDWDLAFLGVLGSGDTVPVLVREDEARAGLVLTRRRWRSFGFLRLSGDVESQRHVVDAEADASRFDRELVGALAGLGYSSLRRYPFSISPERGFAVSGAARRRWQRGDVDPELPVSGGYDELSAVARGFLPLAAPGFSNHVLAVRVSGLRRSGSGAGTSALGGASGSSEPLVVGSVGSASIFLPVRGFQRGVRRGTHAWSASAEYRFPLALVQRGHRLWPFFLDRVSGSAFVDAGDAWCDEEQLLRRGGAGCTPAAASPLVGAGAELGLDLTLFYRADARLRAGLAFPLSGRAAGTGAEPVLYVRLGPSF